MSSTQTSVSPPGGRGSRFLAGGKSLFTTTEEKHVARSLDEGLERIEEGLRVELSHADEIVDSLARYLFDAGGKRIRPLLTLLTAQWGAGVNDRVVTAAQVIELTHLATLYHDDVMDEAAKRRGVNSAHNVWSNSMAILAGDLLFARAGALGVVLGEDAMRRQTETFERLVVGQMRETVGPREYEEPIDHYLGVLADKTGSLIALAAEFGITQSDAPDEYVSAVRGFGEKIGVAFQLVDDVLDLSADEEATGKKAGADVRRGVVTLPVILLERSAVQDHRDAELRDMLKRGASGDLAEEDFSEAISRLRDHGATEQTMEMARSVADQAVEYLADLPTGVVRDALQRFAAQVVERTQ